MTETSQPGTSVSVTENVGGVTRVTIGPGQSLPPPPPTSLGEGVAETGAVTMDARSGVTVQHGAVHQEIISNASDPSLGVMASARSAGGSRSAPITPQSVVDIPGVGTTNLATAARMGFVKQIGPGQWADTGRSGQAFAEAAGVQQQQAPHAPQEVGLLPETETVISKLESSIPQGLHDAFMHALVTAGPDVAVTKYAGHSTLGEGELTAAATHVAASYQASLAHHLSKSGVDHAEFSDWVRANAPAEGRSAAYHHAMTRRASSWDGLVAQFQQKRR